VAISPEAVRGCETLQKANGRVKLPNCQCAVLLVGIQRKGDILILPGQVRD
jgi:hypothetical protein